jgi:hypothetical protein
MMKESEDRTAKTLWTHGQVSACMLAAVHLEQLRFTKLDAFKCVPFETSSLEAAVYLYATGLLARQLFKELFFP